MHGGKQTLYDVLGISRDATPREIARCHRKLSEEMQSEASAPNPRRAALIRQAYEVLSDPQRRAAYDESLEGPRFLGMAGGDGPKRKWAMLLASLAFALGAAHYFTGGSAPETRQAGPALSVQEVHTAVAVSVGRVNRVEMSGARSNLGAAVAVEEGVMMAPCEGIGPGAQILVRIPPRDLPAQLRRIDEKLGLCRLEVSGAGSWPLPMTGRVPNVGEAIYAANLNALGEVVIAPGVVKKVMRGANGTVIDSTARAGTPVNGSPLLDAEGRIVAIVLGGEHTTLPPEWIVDAPLRKRPPPEDAAAEEIPGDDSPPAGTTPEKARERLERTPPEKREALQKAFRPPPSVPDDL